MDIGCTEIAPYSRDCRPSVCDAFVRRLMIDWRPPDKEEEDKKEGGEREV